MDGGPHVGEVKGPYRLLRVIGSGGMGVVYEAWDTRLDRRVALKLLHPHLLSDPARQRGFEREARIAARVEHPNVVRIYRVDQVDGQSVIEMQYIDGQPLSALLRSGPLTTGQAVDVLEQVLEALACCHERGLVHCDLKPGNLLVTPDGRVHLTDFGIARALSMPDGAVDAAPMEPISGPLWGTPRYSPPEAWSGGTPTPQWDLYAAGVLFHELLTGVPLFPARTPSDLMRQILSSAPPPLTETLPNLSPDLSNLAAGLIARDPAQRPSSARVALERLGAYPKGPDDTLQLAVVCMPRAEIQTGPVSAAPVSSGFLRGRLRSLWIAAPIGVLIAGIAGAWLILGTQPAEPDKPPTVSPKNSAPSRINHLKVAKRTAFFSIDDGEHGHELGYFLPEVGHMALAGDLAAGAESSNPRRLMLRSAGDLLFAAYTPESGEELWYCTEVAGGIYSSRMVKDIIPGPMGSEPEPVATHEYLVFFFATTLQYGRELWCTNALSAQTAMVKDIFPGPQGSHPGGLRAASDSQGFYLVILADAARGMAIFRFDYAKHELFEVADVSEDTAAMAVLRGRLFFSQTDDAHGSELWMYDPAAGKLEFFLDIWPGPSSSSPGQFFVWHDRILFQARTEPHGLELWVSDGTLGGTMLLSDLEPGSGDSAPYAFVDGGDVVFFRAKNTACGAEPWRTDGTPEGTVLLADLRPGPEGSVPYNMAPKPGKLFFSAGDGAHGEELFVAERLGKDWQVRLVADLMPGVESSEPHSLQWMNSDRGIFVASLPKSGETLCMLDDSAPGGLPRIGPVSFDSSK